MLAENDSIKRRALHTNYIKIRKILLSGKLSNLFSPAFQIKIEKYFTFCLTCLKLNQETVAKDCCGAAKANLGSHHSPNSGDLQCYQRDFFRHGFSMLKMPQFK
jgi:hypothetical protein